MKITLFGIFLIGTCFAEPQLQLLNVVFRHGDRTPVVESIFPTDPNFNSDFYPMGHGALTNDGKYHAYKLGEFLRTRYKDFLGDVYLPKLLSACSTNFDRTKMSLQLVLAALFPPADVQKWHNGLNWQPIPFTYLPKELDDVLAVTAQPAFFTEKQRVSKTEHIQNRFRNSQAFISRLENLTERKINNSFDIVKVYDTLYSEWKMNLTLPSWSKGIFPEGELLDAALIDYDVMTYDRNMTYQLSGKLASKIKKDILAAAEKTEIEDNKLYLYSGHEVNVAGTLKSLQVFENHIPHYTSAAIIELLKDNDNHYVKVLYYHGDTYEIEEMVIPGCDILCPLEKYLAAVNELLSYEDV